MIILKHVKKINAKYFKCYSKLSTFDGNKKMKLSKSEPLNQD